MANLYGNSQTLNFLDAMQSAQKKFLDAMKEWDVLYAEYVRNDVGNMNQAVLDNSSYAGMTVSAVQTAVGAMQAEIGIMKDINHHPALSAHISQMEVFANRR